MSARDAFVTYGSVCSGIEAVTVAMKPSGWRAAWFAEIEKFPCAVLAHHYATVPNLGDMTKIAAMVRAGIVSAPDVLVGGTPCQAFSIAGLRQSLDDARGQLTLSFVDLANAIDAARHVRGEPAAVIWWENVPGVLNTPDNAFGCFLGALAGEDCELKPPRGGWPNAGCVFGPQRTVAWRVTDAQYFGVAQRRRRVFVVASAREGFNPTAVLFEFEGVRRDSAPSREEGKDLAGTLSSRSTGGGGLGTDFELAGVLQPARQGEQDDGVICMAHGQGGAEIARERRTTLTCNHEAPIVAFGGNNTSGPIDVATCRSASGSASGRLDFESETFLVQARSVAIRGRDGGATAELGDDLAGALRASQGGGDKAHVLAPLQSVVSTIDANYGRLQGASGQDMNHGQMRLVPIAFSSKDYGADAEYDIAPTLRAGGHHASHANAGVPPAIAFDSRQDCITSTDVFGALGCSSPQAQAVAAAHAFDARQSDVIQYGDFTGPLDTCGFTIGVQHHMAVRRLTPRECERLQAFPDDYTLIPFGRVVKLEKLERDWIKYLLRGGVMTLEQVVQAAADGPRYKALGNSMCVLNMRWIGQRIDAALRDLGGVAA